MNIEIRRARQSVEEQLIGFRLNTDKIKPVHLSNGLFRLVEGKTYDTELLHRVIVTRSKKSGVPPTGYDIETVYRILDEDGLLENTEIDENELSVFRQFLQQIVNADNAVFPKQDHGESYSGSSAAFLTRDRWHQSGGEFIAQWLDYLDTPLTNLLHSSLQDRNDILSLLCAPLLSEIYFPVEPRLKLPPYWFDRFENVSFDLNGMARRSAETLSAHLQDHPNKLYQLRTVVLFSSFLLVRYAGLLETVYVPDREDYAVPFLLDFSDRADRPIARASQRFAIRMRQSLSRFYGWALGEELKKFYRTPNELLAADPPDYQASSKQREKSQGEIERAAAVWKSAITRAKNYSDPFLVMGEALYEMLAVQAEANPFRSLNKLAGRTGILYPMRNDIDPRFRIHDDVLEMLLRTVVSPNETATRDELQRRLWDRYRIIVGGLPEDEQRLLQMSIHDADNDDLLENQRAFGEKLRQLEFAELMADGVLKVKVSNVA